MLNKSEMAKTAQLSDFDESLYKVVENEKDSATDKYLIATSEQPISCMVCPCHLIVSVKVVEEHLFMALVSVLELHHHGNECRNMSANGEYA